MQKYRLRNRQLERCKFRHQFPIMHYVLDFACEELQLAIELDGGQHSHEANAACDAQRTAQLEAMGWKILRFWNHEVLENMDGVLTIIAQTIHALRPSPDAPKCAPTSPQGEVIQRHEHSSHTTGIATASPLLGERSKSLAISGEGHPIPHLLTLARTAADAGEVPIAACVVDADGKVIAQAHNEVEMRGDATAHAELLAIQTACAARGEKYLADCTLYVTLEPCAMCAVAASHGKLKKIVFGAYDPKSGGVEHGARVFAHATCHHVPEIVGGVMEAECAALLSAFFKGKR